MLSRGASTEFSDTQTSALYCRRSAQPHPDPRVLPPNGWAVWGGRWAKEARWTWLRRTSSLRQTTAQNKRSSSLGVSHSRVFWHALCHRERFCAGPAVFHRSGLKTDDWTDVLDHRFLFLTVKDKQRTMMENLTRWLSVDKKFDGYYRNSIVFMETIIVCVVFYWWDVIRWMGSNRTPLHPTGTRPKT